MISWYETASLPSASGFLFPNNFFIFFSYFLFMTAFLKSKMGNGYRSAMANVEWKIIRIRSMMKTETMFSGINGMEKKSQIRNMKRN